MAFSWRSTSPPHPRNIESKTSSVVLADIAFADRVSLLTPGPATDRHPTVELYRLRAIFPQFDPCAASMSGPDTVWQILRTASLLVLERRRTPRVDEDGVLFSVRGARLAGQLDPIRSDRAPEDGVRRWLIRRLERAEEAVPHRGADAEVHDLSTVMEVVESLESSQVGDAREVFAMMVLPVVREGAFFGSRTCRAQCSADATEFSVGTALRSSFAGVCSDSSSVSASHGSGRMRDQARFSRTMN